MAARHLAKHTAWHRSVLVWFWLLITVLPAAAQAQAQAQAQSEPVTGDWQQFVFFSNTGTWRQLGVFRVQQSGGEYRMEPVSQERAPDVTNSRGLSNVRFSGLDWRFNSDWGNGNVGEFRLQHIGPGLYRGWSYLREKPQTENIWLRVR